MVEVKVGMFVVVVVDAVGTGSTYTAWSVVVVGLVVRCIVGGVDVVFSVVVVCRIIVVLNQIDWNALAVPIAKAVPHVVRLLAVVFVQ